MSPESWLPDAGVDRGEADPVVRRALASAYGGEESYARAVAALCTARLILPTVPAPPGAEPGLSEREPAGDADGSGPAEDHHGPAMAVVHLRSAAGAKAVAVFTGADALLAWRPDARPVRCTLDDVAATVLETESVAIVVDVAGPHPLVIEAPLVEELARGHRLVELADGGFGWVWLADGGRASPS
nr:SseB family protein [Propionibacterium sp.]